MPRQAITTCGLTDRRSNDRGTVARAAIERTDLTLIAPGVAARRKGREHADVVALPLPRQPTVKPILRASRACCFVGHRYLSSRASPYGSVRAVGRYRLGAGRRAGPPDGPRVRRSCRRWPSWQLPTASAYGRSNAHNVTS